MKHTKTLLATLLTLALLGGCSGSDGRDGTPASNSDGNGTQPLKVALVLPGETTDMGWSTQGYNGLLKAKEELGVTTAYAESITESDAQEYIRGYANDGYDLIIAHSSAYADAVKAVAPSFPEIWFVVTSTDVHDGENMAAYSNDNAEQGFLAGVAAAAYSTSGKVGYIGGQETTPVVQKMNNAELGAKWVNASVEYKSIIMGSYDDLQLAQENTNAMIESGVDVIIANSNKATTTILDVCKEKGVACVALGDYYSELYPNTQIADVINDAATCVYESINDCVNGTIKSEYYLLGTDVNAVFATGYGTFVSDETKAKVESAVEALKSKSIELIY